MLISYFGTSDVGSKRTVNEDRYLLNARAGLFVVADGMGGHAAGEIAAQVTVDSINAFVGLTGGDEEITWPFGLDESISYGGNRLKSAIRYANKQVLEATRDNLDNEGLAATVVATLIDDSIANIGHVGDSRAYLLRDGAITPLTDDHSWVREQVTAGIMSPDEASVHPLRNVVTRAVGGRPDIAVELRPHTLQPDDWLLLCSDGLTTMVANEEIYRIVASAANDLETAAQGLVSAAKARGGEDNITIVLLRFQERPSLTDREDPSEGQPLLAGARKAPPMRAGQGRGKRQTGKRNPRKSTGRKL